MNACIFCRRYNKQNREHIFPTWLQKYLGIEKAELQVYAGSPLELKRKFAYQSHVNGLVCEDCNNGWMNKLEMKVKPIIKSLIEDQTTREISRDDLATVTWWVFKTVLTLHSVSLHEKVIPDQHYSLAYNQRVPSNFWITIGQLSNRLDQPAWIQNQNWIGASKYLLGEELVSALRRTYRVTIGFANLAAQVHYFPLDMPLFPFESSMRLIEPLPKTFIWPPRETIEDLWQVDNSMIVRPPLL